MAANPDQITVDVRPRWWLGYYISGLYWLVSLTGYKPNIARTARFIAKRGMKYSIAGREI